MSSSEPLYVTMGLVPHPVIRPRVDPTRSYRMKTRTPAIAEKLVRPAAFSKYLGMTYDELDHTVKSECCSKWKCFSFISTRDVMEARALSCAISLKELYSWIVNQLEVVQKRGGHFQYYYQTEPICKLAWQRIYGIGDRVLARARKLLANESKVYLKAPSTLTEVADIVSVLLCERFSIDPEITSDGIWKLQEMARDAGIQQYVREHWREACERLAQGAGSLLRLHPDRPPTDATINKIWRTEYKNVSFVRGTNIAIVFDLRREIIVCIVLFRG